MDIVERLRDTTGIHEELIYEAADEIERLREYERLVKFIANDYHELSHEKTQWQRDDWKKRCIAIQQKESEIGDELLVHNFII
jgi:hypothetical protein